MQSLPGKRLPAGFTTVELILVLVMAAIMATIAIRSSGETLRRDRVVKVTNIVASDLEQAFATAARQRTPARVRLDGTRRTFSIASRSDTTFKYRERSFESGDLAIDYLSASPEVVDIMPTGLATSALRVTFGVTSAGVNYRRTINMTRAGLVRIGANP